MNKKNRALSLLLVFAMVLLLIPPFGITASAAYTFSGGIVIIDEALVAAEGNEFIIEGDVFSVTVIGDVDVSIIFNNVTIDRSADSAGTNVAGIYTAGQRLNWTRGYNSFYVPTCPLLITGGASVTARFDGNCTFKAGTSGWYATSDNTNTLLLDSTNRGGYAGIQVDGDSSLTISGAENLIAYGAYQTQNSSTSAGSGKPSGLTGTNNRGGGAGIGGGTSYTSPSAATSSYTQGTPGTIIIDNGNVTAYGGFQAAGIGGGTNSAATTNKIEINGGVVTAHGGAWAAGIGEGDSVDQAASNLFNSEENTYEVVINGGVVTAYGGYSAAAIGTTDAITNGNSFSLGTTSGLSITITGGNITATSGETSTDSLTAAIGAGQNTDMEDNSITIYNEAKIVAASFSRYAISNYGYSTDTPSVNIDPEGYVYLARFGSVTKERTFKVYAIHKNANGHFMYVPTASHDISDGSIDSATTPYYYAYDPGHVSSDGKRIGGFYLVDKDGANVIPSDYADKPDDYRYDEDTKRYYPTTIPAVSAYYDTETIIEEITVPGNYKAVAITLPNPNEYGGSYVLEVPQASGNPIYVLMQKDHPGVTSGEVENASQTHYSAGSNPPSEANSTPNITIDGTARPFTDLDVGIYEGGVAQPTLIPEFTDTVYGYTFYVPHGTERFWLNFSFASSYTDEYANAVSAKLILLTLDGADQGFDPNASSVSLSDLNIGSDGKANVWIKKTDTTIASGSTKTVSYKLTIVVKDKYSFLLNVDALNKIYDGNPVEPSFTALLDGAGDSTSIEKGNLTSQMTQEEKDAITYTFYEDSDGDGVYETSLGTQAPKNAGRYIVMAFLEASKYEAEGSANFVISKKEINLIAIENWLKYVTSEEVTTYDGVIFDPGEIYFDGVVSGESVALLPGATFKYVDTGNAGYADDVSYDDKKIIITNPVLNAASQINYILVGVTDGVCYVHGQIAYSTSGTMFRKADAANTSLWRKFYPIEANDYLTWVTSGGAFTDTRVDYHSPVPNGASADNGYSGGTVGIHREYVKLRTTGDTSERYSVDIEFGAMQFEYTKTIWNVNSGEYEAVEGESKWNGHNGTNNAVTVTNRSNSEIYYQLEFNIDFMYAAISAGADSGIRAALYDTNYALVAGTQTGEKITSTSGKSAVQALLSAAPLDPTEIGTARSKTFLLVLSGVPSSITEDNNINYTNVGSITVTIIEP